MTCALCTLALSLWFTAAAARDLSNFRPVSNDEGELLEVSYTLATQGRLASPMYAGFYNADQHHLWTLPVQHVLDAIAFDTFGAGVAQARWVSVIASLITLWVVAWLALRWFGLPAALLTTVLLTLWRSNLTSGATGVPLLDVARVARYDVLAVAFGWLAVLALSSSRGRVAATAAGAAATLAAVSQFFGVAALAILPIGGCRRWRLAGAVVVAAPWLAFVAANAADLSGQLSVYGQRGAFLRPRFYVDNLLGEPSRYLGVLQQPGGWLLLGVLPAVVWLAWRRPHLLILNLGSSIVLLTLLDQTKTPLYAILLVPAICVALVAAWCALPRHLIWYVLTSVLIVAVVWDGLGAYAIDRLESTQVTAYAAIGARIEAALPADGVVLGPERFWWAAHDRSYLSLRSLWFQWTSASGAVPFKVLVARWQARGMIVNNNIRDDVRAFPPALQAEFASFLEQCTQPLETIDDPTYFEIQIYRVIAC